MIPLERFDQLRRRTLLVGAALTVPFTLVNHFANEGGPWKTAWLLAFAAAMAVLAVQPVSAPRWRIIVPLVVGLVLGPFACAMDTTGPMSIATLPVFCLIVAVLFIDVFDVVVATTIAGTLSTVGFVTWLGWPVSEVVTFATFVGAGAGVVIRVAHNIRELRQLDRQVEAQQNQALRLSESRRAQAERLAIVGRLASGVAHEINNPLAFVKSNVNALRRFHSGQDQLPAEEINEILEDSIQGIERMCQIVADLKGFSREDTGNLEPVELREVVQGAVRLAAVRLPRDVRVRIDVPEGMPLVRANQRKLSQIMLNLLVNAGEALEEVPSGKRCVGIRAIPEGDTVRLLVTDNGPGIPSTVMQRLFEPFFTTKPVGKGTGLGLALSREYVESFGGSILAQNVQPQGAQFVVTLRAAAVTGETPIPPSLLAVAPKRQRQPVEIPELATI